MPPSGPGGFCAWFETYPEGGWYTFDARYIGRVLMLRGRDAAEGAMITSFGSYELTLFRVWTDEVGGSGRNDPASWSACPDAPALTLTSAGTS